MFNSRYFILLTICLSFFSVDAQYHKIDPAFYAYYADSTGQPVSVFKTSSKAGFGNGIKGGMENVLSFDTPFEINASEEIGVIVKTNGNAAPSMLLNAVQINDSIYTGFANYKNIIAMASYSSVKRIFMSKPMFQSSDSAVYYTDMFKMHKEGFTGRGVILGIIDDGISSGADFLFDGVSSRFISIWNQKESRTLPPAGYTYGEELSGSALTTFFTNDNTGHSTSILSALVSRETASAAPDAEIIAVDAFLTTKSVIEAMKYVCRKAETVNAPFALLLPMNHFWGTHKGDEPLEQVINDLFAPAKMSRGISVPAGNLGARYIHFSCALEMGDTSAVLYETPFVVFRGFKGKSGDIDMLPEGAFLFKIFFSLNGEMYESGWINPYISSPGFIEKDGFSFRYSYSNLFSQMHVCMNFPEDMLLGVSFKYLNSNAVIHGYAAQGGYFLTDFTGENFIKGDKNNTIAPPGLAKQAITSGAYVSRSSVPGLLTVDTLFAIPDWNAKSHLNYIKPDVYAPGKFIYAYSLYQLSDRYMVGEHIGAFYGSSYAAAFTAGAMLLLLQTDNFMSNDRLNTLIRKGVTNLFISFLTDIWSGNT